MTLDFWLLLKIYHNLLTSLDWDDTPSNNYNPPSNGKGIERIHYMGGIQLMQHVVYAVPFLCGIQHDYYEHKRKNTCWYHHPR